MPQHSDAPIGLSLFTLCLILVAFPGIAGSESDSTGCTCLDTAAKRVEEIRRLPGADYLLTLDGQRVPLAEFYDRCRALFPWCCLFRKFYYWDSDVRKITSTGHSGIVRHTIRCYSNCYSTECPEKRDPRARYGDVAEFYDQRGRFMGLVVYMGQGTYCSLPYSGYGD